MWSITSFVSVKRMNGKQCLVPLGEITNMQLCRLVGITHHPFSIVDKLTISLWSPTLSHPLS